MTKGKMRVIVHSAYGPPDELQLKGVDKPFPKADEVLIKIHATIVTISDRNIRNLTFVTKLFHLPMRMQSGITKPGCTLPVVVNSSLRTCN